MVEVLRQVSALSGLVVRHWRRSALIAGRSAGNTLGKSAGLLLRLLFVGYMAQACASVGAGIHALSREEQPGALVLSLCGVAAMALASGGLALAPAFRGRPTPLRSPLLATLPTRFAARLFLAFAEFAI